MALSDPLYVAVLLLVAVCTLVAPTSWRLGIILLASFLFCFGLGTSWYILLWVSLVGYCGGLILALLPDGRWRAAAFAAAILAALAPLVYFKYAPAVVGLYLPVYSDYFEASLALPIGISFFTFSVVGYLIDVYVGTMERVSNPLRFATFTTFFPHLTQGPIARAAQFFPQLGRLGQLNYEMAVAGLRLILLGLFMKVVVADTLAPHVSQVYDNIPGHAAADYVLSTVYFAFQVYGDFAGYSLIAIGSGKVLGVELMPNFAQPFLSTTIPEFWRRWHISMSSWFRSYVFVPLQAKLRDWPAVSLVGSMLVTFMLVGIWHGAAPKYVLFGAIHGAMAAVSTLTLKWRATAWERAGLPRRLLWALRLATTFAIVCTTFALFRAGSVVEALSMYAKLLSLDFGDATVSRTWPLILIGSVVCLDILAYRKFRFDDLPRIVRWTIYYMTLAAIVAATTIHAKDGALYDQQFIYYKF